MFSYHSQRIHKENRIFKRVRISTSDKLYQVSQFHSTKAAALSAASNALVSVDELLKTAGWSSESTWKAGPFSLLGIHGSLPYTITRLREIDLQSLAIA